MDIIVVSDTNVFIDLISVGLQDQFFFLPMEVHTTDMVVFEVRREGQNEIMASLIKKADQGNERAPHYGNNVRLVGLLPDWHSELPPNYRKNQQGFAKLGLKFQNCKLRFSNRDLI